MWLSKLRLANFGSDICRWWPRMAMGAACGGHGWLWEPHVVAKYESRGWWPSMAMRATGGGQVWLWEPQMVAKYGYESRGWWPSMAMGAADGGQVFPTEYVQNVFHGRCSPQNMFKMYSTDGVPHRICLKCIPRTVFPTEYVQNVFHGRCSPQNMFKMYSTEGVPHRICSICVPCFLSTSGDSASKEERNVEATFPEGLNLYRVGVLSNEGLGNNIDGSDRNEPEPGILKRIKDSVHLHDPV
ncbi:hypothetical protein Btru_008894 [Bulinus truncatus]|nr:hypothetical protein Btru_008894 [Bulinus truncatus]